MKRRPSHSFEAPVRPAALALALLLAAVAIPRPASAHGLWTHIHVTGWAIENLPPGELRDFFDEPEVREAALFGAVFPDTGYAPRGDELEGAARAYGEHAHWEPFVQEYLDWLLEHEPPPLMTLEARRHVAFLMGAAAHGLQDEIFDSLFLYQVEEHDGAGQAEADPASDGFLVADGHIRFIPEKYVPIDVLLPLLSDLDDRIDAELIESSVDLVVALYVNGDLGLRLAEGLGRQYFAELPWMAEHYLDDEIPGSPRSEILPTAAYLQAIWGRLHGRLAEDDLLIHTFPNPPRRLLGHEASSPDSWVTLVVGLGVGNGTTTMRWLDEADAPVSFTRRDTRFTGAGWSRLVRLQPNEDLEPGATYTVCLDPGAALIDGTPLGTSFDFAFQVDCLDQDAVTCPPLGDLPGPPIDPPAGDADAAPDAGEDAADAGGDAGAGTDDGVDEDPGANGLLDAPPGEAGAEPGAADITEDGGCGCVAAPGRPQAWLPFVLAAWALRRRRSRSPGSGSARLDSEARCPRQTGL